MRPTHFESAAIAGEGRQVALLLWKKNYGLQKIGKEHHPLSRTFNQNNKQYSATMASGLE